MHCPHCGYEETRVIDTRESSNGVRRRRECLACRKRFTTYEYLAAQPLQVVKRDGRREEYDRDKLLAGLRKACTKRPISSEAIERIADQVEAQLAESGRLEVPSEDVGQMVMEKLRELDGVAYIRFASVYLPNADLDCLRREMDRFL